MDEIMFHTQEDRAATLHSPVKCTRQDAWFGWAYYFWQDIEDAHSWGRHSKRNRYKIYEARIISDRVLDIVFNKAHYTFFLDAITKVNEKFLELTGKRMTVADICDYLNTKAGWKNEFDVLLADDIPRGPSELPVPIRKRIQAAVYNKDCVHDFKICEQHHD